MTSFGYQSLTAETTETAIIFWGWGRDQRTPSPIQREESAPIVAWGQCRPVTVASSLSSMPDPWSAQHFDRNAAVSRDRSELGRPLLVRDLGWSAQDAAETYHRLRHFEDNWNAPGMDAYDEL